MAIHQLIVNPLFQFAGLPSVLLDPSSTHNDGQMPARRRPIQASAL